MNNGMWSWEQEKAFERALVEVQEHNADDRWERIAAGVPGKTAEEVKAQHDLLAEDIGRIESGLVPLPDYADEVVEHPDDSGGRERRQGASRDQKKISYWTISEHKAFLRGIAKCGRGNWLRISAEHVPMKTPSQVASHAQKYFQRQAMEKSKKKRQSIHDISLETILMEAATNGSSNGQPICQTDRPANGCPTNGIQSVNGYPAVQSNVSGNGQPIHQTDRPANGYPTNGIQSINGYPAVQSNVSGNGQPIHQTDRLANGYPTNRIPTVNTDMLMNGSSAHQPPQLRNPPARAFSIPIKLRPGTFIPLFRSDDPRASLLDVAPIAYRVPDTPAQPKQEPCRPQGSFRSPVS